MRVLLLSVHEEQAETRSPNLGIYRIRHYLRRNGVPCEVCEIGLEDPARRLREAEAGEYGLIGLSSTYVFLEKELAAIAPFRRAADRCGAFLLAGGQAPSRAAEFWLSLGFDGVVRGYGEDPTLALARALEAGGRAGLASVPSLTWLDGDRVVENPAMPMTRELFRLYNYEMALEMGVPDEWLADLTAEDAGAGQESCRYRAFHAFRLFTSHKCPNRCGYCSSSNFLDHVYGRGNGSFGLTVPEVLDLVRFYHDRHGISFFNIHDDDFTSPKRFTREFCEGVIAMKDSGRIPAGTSFFCQSRVVDFLDLRTRKPDIGILSLMKRAGFNRISFGVENFSRRMLLTPMMHKKGYEDATVMPLLAAARDLDLEFGVNFMVCVPEASPEDVELNLSRLVDVQDMNGIAVLNMFIQAYPGADSFGSERYPMESGAHVSPLNGRMYEKQERFIPLHEDVRDALDHYMNGGVRDEIERRREMLPGVDVREIRMLNLIKAFVMADRLGLSALTRKLEDAMRRRWAQLRRSSAT